MFLSKRHFLDVRTLGFGTALALVLAACGGDQSQAAAAAGEPDTPDEVARTEAGRGATEEPSVGSVTFAVDGNEKRFDYLPESGNVYNTLASTIRAHPEVGSSESFSIVFLSIDLKPLTFPTDLPAPKDLSKPLSPTAAMATVGFGYIDPDGTEWAGPGKVRIESFAGDGVIRGSFDAVTLPQTDDERPDITLTGGTFLARITAQW